MARVATDPPSTSPSFNQRRPLYFPLCCFPCLCGRSSFYGYEYGDLGGCFSGSKADRFINGRADSTARALDHDADVYVRPPFWKRVFRKMRTKTRNMEYCCKATSGDPDFHYDALSYAMNFDDGCLQHTQQPRGLAVLQSSRIGSNS